MEILAKLSEAYDAIMEADQLTATANEFTGREDIAKGFREIAEQLAEVWGKCRDIIEA